MCILVSENKTKRLSPFRCTTPSHMAARITKIGITNDKISGRGGLPIFMRYAEGIGLYGLISTILQSFISQSNKGLQLPGFVKQVLAFFMDGTHMSICHFDQTKRDDGYASVLECSCDELASSHQIKRYFGKLSIVSNQIFNKILHELFIWRLNLEKPKIIELGIDTMVLDNDDALKREGCEVTYKRKKGFQPLHISWGCFLIDVLFRKGSAHSNHGTDYIDRVREITKLIRKRYSATVPIIINADSGFADQKAYEVFEEELHIHYITTGKFNDDIRTYVKEIPPANQSYITKEKIIWGYFEFGGRLKAWKKFRRCIFTKLQCDANGQMQMDFGRPDNIILTNIGNCPQADELLLQAGGAEYFEAGTIVKSSHSRGADELIHRSIKELATKEQLPFKSMGMNRAYYFFLVIAHFLFEAYKRDVTVEVIPITVYPNTFRRKLIDFAVKLTSHSRNIVLKVTKTVYEAINIEQLWRLCQSPPPIQVA